MFEIKYILSLQGLFYYFTNVLTANKMQVHKHGVCSLESQTDLTSSFHAFT